MNFKLTFLLLISSSLSFSQQVKFRKVIGSSGYDYGMSAKQTADHGYIIGGTTTSFGAGATDVYIVKTDSMGIPVNDQTYGGINIDHGNCIRQTTDHGYIIAGYTNSYGAGGYDMYLVKTDSNLAMQWSKTYGGTDWDFANCVEQTADGGYILCGSTYSYGSGDEDYYLVKTSSLGDTAWTKTFGGTNEDIANSVIQTTDGGYLITGTTKSLGDTLGDMYTIKTNASGDTTWTNKFGGFNNRYDKGNDILQSRYGGYILAGESEMLDSGNVSGVLVKIDANGITHADSMFTTYAADYDSFNSIAEDTTGRIAATGVYLTGEPDLFLVIINANWSFHYATNFGANGDDFGNSVESTADGGFILCGTTFSFNNYLADLYLIKTDQAADAVSFSAMMDSFFTTGINEHSNKDFSIAVYPNPVSKELTIISSFINKPKCKITLYNILGEQIYFKQNYFLPNREIINLENFEPGVYILELQTENNVIRQKVIKE